MSGLGIKIFVTNQDFAGQWKHSRILRNTVIYG